MGNQHVEAHAEIPATADAIYAILRDYHNGHPHILPKQYFPRLEVEQGGEGTGTIVQVTTRVMGQERSYRMVVEEVEPGRVLTETAETAGLVTTFTVTPLTDNRSRVTIATDWETAGGLAGFFERLLTPGLLKRVYQAELQQLADFVAENR
jgi:carbon monoxide dehydrogenase subunit G